MEIQKYYFASFNIGNIEVWHTASYLNKKSVLEEIKYTIEEIIAQIACFDLLHSEEEIKHAILELQKNEHYIEDELDFFILEDNIWKDYKYK
ncbi:MAG: hypothetical protein LBI60_07280 [Bacteroidales bacterium]|jgi:hypothetical protein|nr:hypothetical protein [Bacteroidales bacterium]